MATLISNMPAEEVWVRKEYLTDFKSGHGEFTRGVWVSCKSMPGRAFYFETYLPEYAAIYDKLPISAFVSEPRHPIQIWIYLTYSSGTVWTMVLQLYANSS